MTRNRTFYILIITQLLSLIGSRMTGVAVGIQVFRETGSAAPLLIAEFFAEIPLMAFSSIAGIYVDRWDRRTAMVVGDVGQAAGTLLLLVGFASGFQLWHLYLAVFIQGTFATLQSPATQAAISTLVPESGRDRANSIRQIGFPLAGVLAPALAGMAFAVIGLTGVIVIDLLTFFVAVVVISRLHIPRPQVSEAAQEAVRGIWRELKAGWLFLKQRPAFLLFVMYLAFVFFMINGPLALAIPYLTSLFADETLLGLLLAALNFGVVFGSVLLAWYGAVKHRVRWILLGYGWHGLMIVAFGLVRSPVLMMVTLIGLMLPLGAGGALFASIVQSRTPQGLQGRVFAITDQLFTLTTPISFLLTAFLVDEVLEPQVGTAGWQPFARIVGDYQGAGMGLLLVAVGIIIMLATLFIAFVPSVRGLERRLPIDAD